MPQVLSSKAKSSVLHWTDLTNSVVTSVMLCVDTEPKRSQRWANSTLSGDFQRDCLEQKYDLKDEIVEVSEIMKDNNRLK